MRTVSPTALVVLEARGVASDGMYRPELDSLRFLAFFAVFLLHALYRPEELAISRLSGWASIRHTLVGAGAYGVDFFSY